MKDSTKMSRRKPLVALSIAVAALLPLAIGWLGDNIGLRGAMFLILVLMLLVRPSGLLGNAFSGSR